MKLEEKRKEIDAIDSEILVLLNRRAAIAKEIGILKTQAGLPLVDWVRESEIIHRLAQQNDGMELEDEAVGRIYERILTESRLLQVKASSEILQQGELSK
jgi:chorismate mutase/prephenate dehydratase